MLDSIIISTRGLKNIYDRLSFICKKLDGNIIEIGAGTGSATKIFLESIINKDANVIVIDPFESGWNEMPESYGRPYPRKKFDDEVNDAINKASLIVFEKSSQSKEAIDFISSQKNIAFIFIDGLQFEAAVLSDLECAKNCNAKIICLDDYNRESGISQVPSAVKKFLQSNINYRLIYNEGHKEVYLIKTK